MKSFVPRASLVLAVAIFLLGAPARAKEWCDNRTLEGDYAFTISGQIYIPNATGFLTVQRQGVATTHFDGLGNFTQEDFVLSDPLAPPPPGVAPVDPTNGFHNEEGGTYIVNKDCTGVYTINFPPFTDPSSGKQTPGAIISVRFVLSDHGRALHGVVTSLTPPGAPKAVPALILAEGHKLGKVEED